MIIFLLHSKHEILTFWRKMISLYQDIMISFWGDILIKENKANRTKQVQFRMDPELFNKLKATIVYDKNVHSMADLFNEAAEKYLKEREIGGNIK